MNIFVKMSLMLIIGHGCFAMEKRKADYDIENPNKLSSHEKESQSLFSKVCAIANDPYKSPHQKATEISDLVNRK